MSREAARLIRMTLDLWKDIANETNPICWVFV
jgi:hypothetical protein